MYFLSFSIFNSSSKIKYLIFSKFYENIEYWSDLYYSVNYSINRPNPVYTPLYRNLMESSMLPNYSLFRLYNQRNFTLPVTRNNTFPKEQAFIIDIIEGVIVKEHVLAILLLITSSFNVIRFFSRISNDRICIYLDSKTKTRNFLLYKFSSHKILFINNITPQLDSY